MMSVAGEIVRMMCTLTSACAVVVLSSFEVAVTIMLHGLVGTSPGAVYVIVLLPVGVIVPKAVSVTLPTGVVLLKDERLQVTSVLLVPVTLAVYCTVLGVLPVLTGIEAGDAIE